MNQYECERCGNLFFGADEHDCPNCPATDESSDSDASREATPEEIAVGAVMGADGRIRGYDGRFYSVQH